MIRQALRAEGAQWHAETYAELLGGTVEQASTALTQSEWTQRETSNYTREQLDAAWEAIMAEDRRRAAPLQSLYRALATQSGSNADVSA